MKKILSILPAIFFLAFALKTAAQVREKISINSGWQFSLNDQPDLASLQNTQWQKINLPHTWNALDIIDDTLGYHQGIGWYKTELFIAEDHKNKHLELFFEGACNKTEVFINNSKAGEHVGGFTGFSINLHPFVKPGEKNEIIVKVDNSKYLKDTVPPFSGDFNLMGGIYRDVWLIVKNPVHFGGAFASNGIFFKTPVVSAKSASFVIQTSLAGQQTNQQGHVKYFLKHKGITVKSGKSSIQLNNDGAAEIKGDIINPKLWSPEQPNLYQLHVQLFNSEDQLLDEVSCNVGFRWFSINRKNEFVLNGKPYKLNGASRHQDYHRLGNALPDALHRRDIELMKDMGCNFLRIAHYPQDPAIYNACDELGLISWSEIPVVDRYVNNETFSRNSMNMMQEMILQNFNHPSVVIWGYHNEVRNLEEVTVRNAKSLDSISKKLDPQRLTAIAFEANIEAAYFTSNPLLKEMLNIADINGYNVYQGWYRGRHQTIGSFLDTLYDYNPSRPIMLSEYGAGSLINIHAYQTSLFDFSEEYQSEFHESYIKAGNLRPWMVGFSIWNFIDFQRDGREDVKPHINKKGMVTTDRQKKDVFYYYKSQWSKQPFVHITGKNWAYRIATTSSTGSIKIPVVVFSNQQQLSLLHNGKLVSTKKEGKGKFTWQINAVKGNNQIICTTPDGKYADAFQLNYFFIDTNNFQKQFPSNSLQFNTGQSRTFFVDPETKEQWIPDKRYTKGTWGYVGGELWNTWPSAAWNGIREGIHKPIANTTNEPIFQTFVQGLIEWKADVPAGKYVVTILFSEPFLNQQRNNVERIFDVSLNNFPWLQQLNLAKDYGVQHAAIFKKEIIVKDGEGITIGFKELSGKTILNGVSIEKL